MPVTHAIPVYNLNSSVAILYAIIKLHAQTRVTNIFARVHKFNNAYTSGAR